MRFYLLSTIILPFLCSGAVIRGSEKVALYPPISATSINASSTAQNNVIYLIGAGYNIFKGNPDGDLWSKGGDDPGLLLTKKILFTDSSDHPQQVEFAQRHGCQVSHEFDLIYSPKSYQDRLNKFITLTGLADIIKPYAFTQSLGFKALSHQTVDEHYVFQDYTSICSIGSARYKSSLAGVYNFPVTEEFAIDVCKLPDHYTASTYMEFIDKWGTHVITETDYGQKLTNRYRTKINDYVNYIVQNVSEVISSGGRLSGFPTSISVDMNKFKFREESRHQIGTLHDAINVGGSNFYDDIKLVLSPITDALEDVYWPSYEVFKETGLCVNTTIADLRQWQQNIAMAINEYPSYHYIPVAAEKTLAIPVTWPRGTYTLEKPISGCPDNRSWSEGYRYEQTEKQHPDSTWSTNNHFDAYLFSDYLTLRFCTKYLNHSSIFDIDWQKGDYCLYKHGPCPSGFVEGSLFIDDENLGNHNAVHGAVPDGVYNRDTIYKFCCRSDGSHTTPIYLPTAHPFYLFKYKYGCQAVHGMSTSEEFLEWDIEDTNPRIHTSLVHPAGLYNKAVTRLVYCYYRPIENTFEGMIIG